MILDSPIGSSILSTLESSLVMTFLMSAVKRAFVSSLEVSSLDIFLILGSCGERTRLLFSFFLT